jgi:hypothetical protein
MLEATENSWGEDCNYISAPITMLQANVPVRARKIRPNALYEIVTVVGARAFPATQDPRTIELDLPARSLSLVERVNLHFATVTWAVDDTCAAAVRLNAEPDETEVRYAWDRIASALCEDLAHG